MKRWCAVGSALAIGLFGLAATPTSASAAGCVPTLEVLSTVSGPTAGDTAVLGLSDYAIKAAVGVSNGLPVYWKNGLIKKVPLPAGYTTGRVTAVNHFGLMVGTVSGPSKSARAFRYWSDQKAIAFYAKGTVATDVNNAGRAVGYDAAAGYEYGPGTSVRRTLAVPAGYTLFTVTGISDTGRIIGNGSATDSDGNFFYAALTWSPAAGSVATALHPTGPGDTYSEPRAAGIDNLDRIAGEEYNSRVLAGSGAYWTSPAAEKTGVGTPALSGSAFTAISQTNKIVVGYAYGSSYDYAPEPIPADQAIIWRPGGSAKVLPSLAVGQPARALAADNDGRAAGRAADGTGVQRPVVWNCSYRF